MPRELLAEDAAENRQERGVAQACPEDGRYVGSKSPIRMREHLEREAALVEALVAGAERGLIISAHDIAEGGFAVALAEACFNPRAILGAEVELGRAGNADAVDFFGEGASTVVLSMGTENVAQVEQLFAGRGIEFAVIGRVTSEHRLKIVNVIDEDVSELMRIYENAIPRRLAGGD